MQDGEQKSSNVEVEAALRTFLENEPHKHLSERIANALIFGNSRGVDPMLLIRADGAVHKCDVCAVQFHSYVTDGLPDVRP